jgi:hypothetical protein
MSAYLPANTIPLTIHDSRGRLTAYGLSCGYIERKKLGFISVTLWREHDVYHVRAHDHDTGQRVLWDSFDTLFAARRYYDESESLLPATTAGKITNNRGIAVYK